MIGEILLIFVFISALLIILLFVRKANLDVERRLTDIITNELRDIRGNVDSTTKDMNQQINSFVRETTNIKQGISTMEDAVKNISSFQEFFRAPKIRGEWGEASLRHLLKEYFPEDLFIIQHGFSSGEKVDAVLKLPDKKLLPIDAKFPFDNFRKMIEAEEKEKSAYRKKFLEDAKKHIQKISEKYILPSENTVDFAIMYIPAEAVYYEINMAHDIDVAEYARSKKIIISSPNTLYLTLRGIEQWFRDTQLSSRAHDIMKRISRMEKDGEKLSQDFRKLGVHLKNAGAAYKSSRKRVKLFDKKVKGLLKNEKANNLNINKKINP